MGPHLSPGLRHTDGSPCPTRWRCCWGRQGARGPGPFPEDCRHCGCRGAPSLRPAPGAPSRLPALAEGENLLQPCTPQGGGCWGSGHSLPCSPAQASPSSVMLGFSLLCCRNTKSTKYWGSAGRGSRRRSRRGPAGQPARGQGCREPRFLPPPPAAEAGPHRPGEEPASVSQAAWPHWPLPLRCPWCPRTLLKPRHHSCPLPCPAAPSPASSGLFLGALGAFSAPSRIRALSGCPRPCLAQW